MSRTRFAVAVAVSILGASFVGSPSAQAATFNFLSPAGALGTTQSYTVDGLTITAAGFHGMNFSTPNQDLYGKTSGGDENGLGLTNDVRPRNYARIIRSDRHTHRNISSASFTMDSVTGGEGWNVYGSNSATTLGTLLLTGTSEQTSNSLALYSYYFFTADGGNVLLGSFTIVDPPAVPLPAALPLFATGLGMTGLLGWRRKRKAQVVA